MGLTVSKLFTRLFGKKEMRILMVRAAAVGLGTGARQQTLPPPEE